MNWNGTEQTLVVGVADGDDDVDDEDDDAAEVSTAGC